MKKINIIVNCNRNKFLQNWKENIEEYTFRKLNKGKFETFLGKVNNDEILLSFYSHNGKVNFSMSCFKGKIIEENGKIHIEGKFTFPLFMKFIFVFMTFITMFMSFGVELSIFALLPFWIGLYLYINLFHHYDYVKEILINKIKTLGDEKADYIYTDKSKLSNCKIKISRLLGLILVVISIWGYLKMIGFPNQQKIFSTLGYIGIIFSAYFNKEKSRAMLIGKRELSLKEEMDLEEGLDEIDDILYEDNYKFKLCDLLSKVFSIIITVSIIAMVVNVAKGNYTIPEEFIVNKNQRPNYFVTEFLVDNDNFYIEKSFHNSVEVYNKEGNFLNTTWIDKNEEFINIYLDEKGKENLFILSSDSEYENYYLYMINKEKFTLSKKIQYKESDVEKFQDTGLYEGMSLLESIEEDIYPTTQKDNITYKLKFNKIIVNNNVIELENSKLLPLPMGLLLIFIFISLFFMYIIESIYNKMEIKNYLSKRKEKV